MHKVEFNRVVLQADKKLVGMAAEMSVTKDATPSLWQRFMPRRNEIQNTVGSALFSVQHFAESQDFENFTPETVFEKWAAVEVENSDSVPDGMQSFVLRGGHFAVFDHQGPPSEFPKTLSFIFIDWLPRSEWSLDAREHFEMLLPGWRPDDPEAREEVWIPLKQTSE
ncbi:MAG: hypothetical protein DHS20C12_21980 [Pseudohongiella sp.]|nr:MAG: hypothetical protein DHS20C12_21980 [Pseudohongiella sp.]